MDNKESNILPFVQPKTVKSLYKRIPIKLMFIPATHSWRWEITIISETKYTELAETEAKARKAAQKYIDKHELGK